jgi:hypothetical protein
MLICLIGLVHFNRQFLFYISSTCMLPGNRYTMFVPSNAAISSCSVLLRVADWTALSIWRELSGYNTESITVYHSE